MTVRKPWSVVVGVGQLGGIFSHGCLRRGQVVVPVTRTTPFPDSTVDPPPELVVLSVSEPALPDVAAQVPEPWRDRTVLVQNELLPRVWRAAGLERPTVAVVWFEKKPGRGAHEILSTPVAGPVAGEVVDTLAAMGLSAHVVGEGPPIADELVAKNLYILGFNIAGLEAPVGATVQEVAARPRFSDLAAEILALQSALLGRPVDEAGARRRVMEAVAADPDHRAQGRTAPARLTRALAQADAHGLAVPALRDIAARAT